MNHLKLHSDNPSTTIREYGNVIPVPSIRVVGISDLLNLNLCSTSSPSVKHCVSTTVKTSTVVNSIVVLGKMDKAWMLRKIIRAGRRKTFT